MVKAKVCKKCGIEKLIDSYYPDRTYPDNRVRVCKDCQKIDRLARKKKITTRPVIKDYGFGYG